MIYEAVFDNARAWYAGNGKSKHENSRNAVDVEKRDIVEKNVRVVRGQRDIDFGVARGKIRLGMEAVMSGVG